ncbi:MAG: hypothetical protein WCQ69_06865 [Bacteroidales bacterium]|jgi:hypothetical protein|nr:hypothetical protein [Bacteroidales bacterium]MDD2263396.1 hypothetical protein [Bacteroidales bacterium]MDD2830814.1 hypothetical protein [Bacteroidales bacterium]MDD3208013.1 hypothetical protein [Bacteroidales bacterium]MDD3696480.1 hypothetical protein [Bacteroidales bacterium]
MKKIFIVLLLIPALMISACGNKASKKKDIGTKAEINQQEQYLTEDLIIKIDSLIAGFQKLGVMPHMKAIREGTLVLTEREKRVKPTFLTPLTKVNDLVTLNQKSRALAIYAVDREIAVLYDMPVEEYDRVLAQLMVETDNVALMEGTEIKVEVNTLDLDSWIVTMGSEQLEKEQVHLFFETMASGILEALYITSLEIPRYIKYFNDETASDVSYRFLLVVEGIESLMPYHPELESISGILDPLKVINAINVKQLEEQLNTLAGEIATARNKLLD